MYKKRKRGRPKTKNIKTPPPIIVKMSADDYIKYIEVKAKLEKIDKYLDKNKKTMKNDYELLELEKTINNHHNLTISTKLSLSIKNKFDKHCSKKGKSTSTLIREMIVAYLENTDFQERVLNHITLTEIDKLQERIDVLQKSLVKKKRKYTITKPRRTPMTVAKEIRKKGESWKDALKRASKIVKTEEKH